MIPVYDLVGVEATKQTVPGAHGFLVLYGQEHTASRERELSVCYVLESKVSRDRWIETIQVRASLMLFSRLSRVPLTGMRSPLLCLSGCDARREGAADLSLGDEPIHSRTSTSPT